MTPEAALTRLTQLAGRYRRYLYLQLVLQALSVGFLVRAISLAFVPEFSASALAFVAVVLFVVGYMLLRKPHRVTNRHLASYVNTRYVALEQSVDLLLLDKHSLNNLQKLQQERVAVAFANVASGIRLPGQLSVSVAMLVSSMVASFLLRYPTVAIVPATASYAIIHDAIDSTIRLDSARVTITAPRYTQAGKRSIPIGNLQFQEGATLQWYVRTTAPVRSVRLIYSGGDTLKFASGNGTHTLRYSPRQTGLYQLVWATSVKTFHSPLFKAEQVNDNPPSAVVTNLQQFTELDQLQTVELKATLRDDYGLTDADIIATVAKGSGESVKFREVQLRFSSPRVMSGQRAVASTQFDLLKLGLEPGDELYFYVQTWDNRQPVPNKFRTETFFISVKDTAQVYTSADEGLGVDLMPEYFRSQRQIIIDTEKLLRNRKALSKDEFNFTSNELGYDQKVLRLRYSEFMGEEFVSGIGPQPETDVETEHDHEEEEDVTKTFGHVHDTENEHNLVSDHDHEHEPSADPDKKENPLEAFVHAHDDAEEATFFIQSVKAKLRAALTLMWDSELHLRLFEPEKSLPYQYKILNLLKEISNDSRIYVHRTGFDPPPIKEDKRYSAELQDVQNSRELRATQEDIYAPLDAGVQLLNTLLQTGHELSDDHRRVLQKAGQTLGALATDNPLPYFHALQSLQMLLATGPRNPLLIQRTRDALLSVLPSRNETPAQHPLTLHPLDQQVLERLIKKHD